MDRSNTQLLFQDHLPLIEEHLGGDGLIEELCKGFQLLMDVDKGVITFESLKNNSLLLGLQDLSDCDLLSMLREGDYDGDGALNQMEFCVLMFRLSPDLMKQSEKYQAATRDFEPGSERLELCLEMVLTSNTPLSAPCSSLEQKKHNFEFGMPLVSFADLQSEARNNTCVDSLMAAKVYIVYYSMYGHVEKLAQEIMKGASSVEGVEAKLWQAETLNEEVLGKMSAPPKSDAPIITPHELAEADGFIFGFPTRFGMMAAQFKAFFDATGGLWRTQQLAGKPAGIFYSTGSQGGGQETTPLTAITQLVHHGMIFVPIGYTFGAGMFEMEKVKGGSPYGAGTYAGDGSRQPSELELEQAFHQGKYIAIITKKLKGSV
ncbi:hypothetical protein E3N88_27522 [Mikania micrantha]|uniref:NAD(P)H dehydrogenase (quinone) n=1 Tax=Mikania micrantha TaxID=192012 RepID=A0A5N6MXH9_9ASTR|nr:hypothetical protein E3N88_27522 [Mikania micrantha]